MINFDNAATSRYKPSVVKKAVLDALRHSANPGRGSHDEAIRAAMTVGRTRDAVLRFADAKHANVVFTKNCTEALNLAILGTVRPGDHVVTTVLEHNSVLRPLHMLQKEGLITLTIAEGTDGIVTADDIEGAVTEKTSLVAVTAMSNVIGYAPPLREIGEICAKKGVKLLVDGAQALGHIPFSFDKIGADRLCGAAHKGLHGMMGCGFLVFSKRIFVNPLMYGGTGTESDLLYQPKDPPESLEAGTLNLPGIAALGAGIEWTKKHFGKIEKRIAELSFYLHEKLSETSYRVYSVAGSPILSFALEAADSQTVGDVLNQEFGIAVRSGLHCAPLLHKTLKTNREGLVRASFGYENDLNDAKKFLFALKEIEKRLTK